MKKLVAYSSVSHLGFCMLGIGALTTEGVTGAVYQMVAHGLSTGGLFLLVGVIYERRHTRLLQDFGGIARRVPIFAFFLVFVSLASAGLPALSGFPGEFLILLGTFTAGAPLDQIVMLHLGGANIELGPVYRVLAILAATGVILAAVYLLWMVQKVLFGPLQNPANERLKDMNTREILVLAPLAILMVVLGMAPGIVLKTIEPSAKQFVVDVNQRAGHAYAADPGAKREQQAAARPILRPALQPAPGIPFRPQLQQPRPLMPQEQFQ
jgi:NADH-quinone oxidoreductase subunit M